MFSFPGRTVNRQKCNPDGHLQLDSHQQNDLSEEYPEVVDQLKHKMLELKSEMIRDGGDWFGD